MTQQIKELKIELLDSSPNTIKGMWLATRNCYEREGVKKLKEEYNEDKAIKLLQHIYSLGHLSIFEQSFYQFNLSGVSRSCLAQMTRHRIGWSYAVQSQHFQNHTDFSYKGLEQYYSDQQEMNYFKLMKDINTFYKDALKHGIPKYIAREVLPNSTSVNMVTSTNLRALDNFWKLRSGKENTPEIREVSKRFYELVIDKDKGLEKIMRYPC